MKVGDVIDDQFEVEDLAGEGGMGAVYRARDIKSKATVALKVIRGADRSSSGQRRFSLEVRVLAKLGLAHPGIVRYIAHGTTQEGLPYLAMEWLQGKDLAALLSHVGRLTVGETIILARRVSEALAAAHALGVVHRDIKPQNLFLPDGDVERIKLVDFGVARHEHETHVLTRTNAFLGTPSYAAPEQVRSSREADARADLFSLGCVMFECLTGRPPFVAEHLMALFTKVLFEEMPPVSEHRPEIPQALCDLISRMLSKNPAERPEGAAAVAGELSAIDVAAPLQEARRSRTLPPKAADDQRFVSVILAGSPEAQGPTVDRVTPAFERLRALVTPLDARVECLASGSVVAAIMGTGAAIDQVTHAARCALSMRAAAPDVPMVLTTGRSALNKRLPIGQVIDRAVSLLQAHTKAELRRLEPLLGPSPILLDELSAKLLETRFEIGGEPGTPVLVGEREADEGMRTLLGKPTPCVGREREIAMLDGLFRECVTEPRARAVLVTAASGIGKSRLRHEFLSHIRRHGAAASGGTAPAVWVAHGNPLHAGSPFGMAGQIVRRAARLREDDPPERRRSKLRTRVAMHVGSADAARVTEILGEIAGAPFPDEGSLHVPAARRDPARMSDQVRLAFGDFLAAECAARPLLLVLEDLHWSDVPSMKLIDDALSRLAEEPFMVVALARPELHEIAPDLWRERDAQELRLGTLSRKASTALARRVLGEGIAEETIERVVQQAGGNAFYLEELIRAVAEGAGGSLPETVLAMVQSRLDGLKPEARQVTRAASVFGEVFWAGGVAALVEGTHSARRVEDCLLALVDRELIRPSVSSKIPGEKEYIFRHALVRDEAYATLSEGDRALGHRLAAEWLEQAGRTDAIALVERFGLIGDHFLRGEAWAKGADYLHKAGDAAFKLHAYPEARAHFDRALLCLARLPETDEQRLHRINILLCYHETVWLGEELDSNLERLREALRLAQAIEGPERQSHVEGEATLEAARRSEDSMIIWAAHWIRAWGHANLGDREAAELHAQQANAAFRSFGGRLFTGDWFLATNAGRVLLAGQPAEALILAQEAVDKARRVEGLYGEALAHRFWGQALMALDPPRLEDAEGHLAESERLLEICDAKPEWARTHKAWGLLCLARGDLVEARRHFEEAAAQFEACGLPDELSSVRALLR